MKYKLRKNHNINCYVDITVILILNLVWGQLFYTYFLHRIISLGMRVTSAIICLLPSITIFLIFFKCKKLVSK